MFLTILFILLVLLVLLKIAVSTYLRIIDLESDVDEYLVKIDYLLAFYVEFVSDVGDSFKGRFDYDEDAFGIISDLRHKKLTPDSLSECAVMFQRNRELTNQFIKYGEDNPKIRNHSDLESFNTKLVALNNRIAVARQRYNDTVFRYNSVIGTVLGSIIAKVTNRTEHRYFEYSLT